MTAVIQGIVDAMSFYVSVMLASLREFIVAGLLYAWMSLRFVIEFIWNYTIGIAAYTLGVLTQSLGLALGVDFSQFVYWFEVANAWLPISEALEVSQGLYAFYLFLFAYRWIKWALPFI